MLDASGGKPTTTKTTKVTKTKKKTSAGSTDVTAAGRQAAQTAGQQLTANNKAFQAALDNYKAMMSRFGPQQMGAQMKEIGALFPDFTGNVLTTAQVRKNAMQDTRGMIDPLLDNIRDMYSQRSRQGTQAIGGLTSAFQGRMNELAQGVQSQNAAGLAQMSGLDAGLANFTRDRNASLQGDLGAALGGMNASQGLTDATAGVTSGLGNQLGIDVAALGTSTAQRMQQEAMAANSFAGLQPIFAAQHGARQLAQFQSGLTQGMQEDLGKVEAEIPQMVNQVYGQLLDRQSQQESLRSNSQIARGQAMTNAYGDMQQRNLNAGIAGATVMENLARLAGQGYSDALGTYGSIVNTNTGALTDLETTTIANQDSIDAAAAGDDPWKIAAAAAIQVDEQLRGLGRFVQQPDPVTGRMPFTTVDLTPNIADDPENTKEYATKSWAHWHPNKAREEIESMLRLRLGGVVPENIIQQKALELMRTMGLRTSLPKQPATAGVKRPGAGQPVQPAQPGQAQPTKPVYSSSPPPLPGALSAPPKYGTDFDSVKRIKLWLERQPPQVQETYLRWFEPKLKAEKDPGLMERIGTALSSGTVIPFFPPAGP